MTDDPRRAPRPLVAPSRRRGDTLLDEEPRWRDEGTAAEAEAEAATDVEAEGVPEPAPAIVPEVEELEAGPAVGHLDPEPGTSTAGRVIATILGTLALSCLLCADSLVQLAERQPFGTGRDIALDVTRPIRSVSHAVGLHLPRLWLAQLTGNEELPTSAAGEQLDVPSATVPSTTEATKPPATQPDATVTSTTLPPTTTTTLPVRRTPTAEDPLRVVMFGDSLIGHLAVGFQRHVAGDARVHVYSEYHVGTGLARPDVLDWPAYLAQILPGFNPEVVYLMFGGNDDQDMQAPDGSRVSYGTPAWTTEYTRRVALAMDVAAQNDRTVVWIGLPTVNRERLNQAKDLMNAIAVEQAALRPRVVYADIGSVLTPGGQFLEHITRPDGSQFLARASDGVHVSIPGGEYVAPTLLGAIATDWNLVAPPAPATTAPPPPTSLPP